jgi:threonine-phosphate decarboxylase
MAAMAIKHGGNVFALARQQGWDWREVLDFSASINPLGPSPRVRDAICGAIERIAHYPDREPARLQAALADAWKLDYEQVLCGNGATELISFLARVCAAEQVTLTVPVFSEFHRLFPKAAFVDLLTPATWPGRGLLVLTRPANPTGWTLPLTWLESYLSASEALVVVDESFIDFSGEPSAACLIDRYPKLVILRSLTKFYALPGLRIGALVGHTILIHDWREQREPWQVNILAEEAALAALADQNHSNASLGFVKQERAWLSEQIARLPLALVEPATANFLFVRLGYRASELAQYLLMKRIIIRNCADWPGLSGESVRVAIRTREENEPLLAAWREFPCD